MTNENKKKNNVQKRIDLNILLIFNLYKYISLKK